MRRVFVKLANESYALLDKETGEIKELKETFVVDEEKWLKLYASLFCLACDNLSGQAIKLFIVIMKYALYDEKGEGNLFYTSDINYKKDIEKMKLKKNISRTLKELCDKGLLYRVNNGAYRLNPQIAYAGNKLNHANLILNVKNKK